MAFSIDYRPVISGGHLKSPIVIKHTQEVDGIKFMKVCKSDTAMSRLLVNEDTEAGRPLSMSDVLEQLVSRRNSAYNAILTQKLSGAEEGKEDLGLDCAKRRRQREHPEVSMPKVATLEAPDIEDVQGIPIKVILSKSGQALWVELSVEVLTYLRDAISMQISSGHVKRTHPGRDIPVEERVTSDVKGVSYSYKRQSVRVRVLADGQPVQKYFKVKDSNNVDDQLREAELWKADLDTPMPLPLQDGVCVESSASSNSLHALPSDQHADSDVGAEVLHHE